MIKIIYSRNNENTYLLSRHRWISRVFIVSVNELVPINILIIKYIHISIKNKYSLIMKRILIFILLTGVVLSTIAQMPGRTPENIEKYKKICRGYIYKEMKGMYREPGGALKYPFLAPG